VTISRLAAIAELDPWDVRAPGSVSLAWTSRANRARVRSTPRPSRSPGTSIEFAERNLVVELIVDV
jgi:hypothetical protein